MTPYMQNQMKCRNMGSLTLWDLIVEFMFAINGLLESSVFAIKI
jgi:hypothetical protein